MPVVDSVNIRKFIEYTGTNGAEVSAFANVPIWSDTGTKLILGSSAEDPFAVMRVGDRWAIQGVWDKADYERQWVAKSSLAGVPDGVGTSDIVSVSVPLLLLGVSAERVITWNRPFANANYKVSFAPDANTIGKITPAVKVVNGSPVKSTTGMTITISAGLAVTVVGVLHVLATT